MKPIPRSLARAIHLALLSCVVATPGFAQSTNATTTTLDTVQVVAIGEDPNKIASPYSVISADKLASGSGTLGEALEGLPGVRADTFGGGASRPVIRGQSAPRVKVLSDSSSIFDASDISPDHAVTVDPLLGERIEVLRGPATLLYGGGAIGGVVNVLDNKIPTSIPQAGVEGRVAVRGNTVADEKAGAVSVNTHLGNGLVLHSEAAWRDADDYKVPDWKESHVDGTFSESKTGSIGLSWVTDQGYTGIAYSYREDDYGLPGHEHEYADCHSHSNGTLDCGGHGGGGHQHQHQHSHDDEAPVIALLNRRIDLRSEYRDVLPGISRIRVRGAHTDYRHHEIEGDDLDKATTFSNKGFEGRVEVEHVPLGNVQGVVGVQYSDTQFESAGGSEAFLPRIDSTSTGLFVVEHVDVSEQLHVELGARHEWLKHEPVNDSRKRPIMNSTAASYSGAAIWSFQPDLSLTLSAAQSQRLPHAQELYARGVHLATNTYECGLLPTALTCGKTADDKPYQRETSNNIELLLRKTEGPVTFSLGAFANNVDDYIYARTLDVEDDVFRLIKYSQKDAKFRGYEAEMTWHADEWLSLTGFMDQVKAKFKDNSGYIPRIPGLRYGTRLNAELPLTGLDGELEFYRVREQNKVSVADYESVTPGHNMLNLTVNYSLPDARTKLFLRASNLLDVKVWNHSSFLAKVTPQPGRNLSVGMSYDF